MGSSGSRPSAPAADAAPFSKQSRKNKHTFLAPILRSVSCGTSSSWRKDSCMQESPITSGDSLAQQITLEKSYEGLPGSCRLQSSGDTHIREVFDEYISDNVSAASSQSLSGGGESTDPILFNGCSSSIVDRASHSLLGEKHRYCHNADRQATSISRSQRSFATGTSTDECSSTTYSSCADLSSNELTSEQNEINIALSRGSIARQEDTSRCMLEQGNSASHVEFGRPFISFQDGSRTEIDASSSQDTVSTQHSDDIGGLQQVEASGLDSQTLDDSSSISRGELSGREARRNNGRRLWDALTRASSRRRRFSPSFVLASQDIDRARTLNDDWELLDWNNGDDSSNFPYESGVLSRRSSDMEGRRWRARPQVWALQHFSDSMEGTSGRSRHCAFGRHPNGHCSCEAFLMAEESSTRASISRIVMLAEALFEVLDEIHRQSVTLSRSTSLSLVSSPAPEAVVNSLAVKIHKKSDTSASVLGECAECYICLLEYEEGDNIRVLPCCHEFHKLCVDRWLKEAHRVCPLCRCNVCEETVRA